ncbi:MAG TPA: MBL fold metallo-hydrolase [Solirubrobacterales bacterium]|nr:MBL fold metallo-hydrolase [Solirubrobacterales bacterium]
MIFRQFLQDDLACASYMVGDGGTVAVVDPKFEIDGYLQTARYLGVRIEHILETHNHADHVSGHGRLAAATGATIHVHRLAEPDFAHEAFDDGWELELGELVIRALHTPGHRPEHTAFALIDRSRSEEPWALLTGDTLFVGDVARPDLAIDKEEGARGIFESLNGKLLGLPPATEVWPGHLGGSMCGSGAMSPKISSTVGFEFENNAMLRIEDPEEFVSESLARIGEQPPNFQNIVAINRGELLTDGVDAHPLTPGQLQRRVDGGAFLVDTRTALQFDDAHIPGATHISILEPGFASRLAWLAEAGQEIVFAGRDDADGARAVELAQAVGLRDLGGFLVGGMTAWREEERETERTERLTVRELKERFDEGSVQILDVRGPDEYANVHIDGSTHATWHDIESVPDGIDPSRPIATVCGSGARAAIAASLLQRFGAEDVLHVFKGGVGAWRDEGWPVEGSAVA